MSAPALLRRPVRRPDPVAAPALTRADRARRLVRWLLPLIPAALASLLIIPGIGRRQLWNDELATYHAVTIRWHELVELLDHIDRSLAAYYLIMRPVVSLAGDGGTALRLPAAVAMVLAAATLVPVGRRLFNTATGLVGGVIFALLPTVTRYGQEARPYALVIAAVTIATLLLLRAIESPTWRRWMAYTAVMVLACWLHIVAGLVMAAHLIVMRRACGPGEDLRRWRWVFSVFGTIGLVAPLALLASKQSFAIEHIKADLAAVRAFPARLIGDYPLAAALLCLAIVGVLAYHRTRRAELVFTATWAVLPVLATYLSFPVLGLFLYRYLLFTLPAWSLLAAAGVCLLAGQARRSALPVTALLAVVGVGLLAQLASPGRAVALGDPPAGQPDYRAAARVVRAHMLPNDPIAYADVFGHMSDVARKATNYEFRDATVRPVDILLRTSATERGWYGALECDRPAICIGTVPRLWVISTNGGPEPIGGTGWTAWVRENYSVAQVWQFSGARAVLLTRKSTQR